MYYMISDIIHSDNDTRYTSWLDNFGQDGGWKPIVDPALITNKTWAHWHGKSYFITKGKEKERKKGYTKSCNTLALSKRFCESL